MARQRLCSPRGPLGTLLRAALRTSASSVLPPADHSPVHLSEPAVAVAAAAAAGALLFCTAAPVFTPAQAPVHPAMRPCRAPPQPTRPCTAPQADCGLGHGLDHDSHYGLVPGHCIPVLGLLCQGILANVKGRKGRYAQFAIEKATPFRALMHIYTVNYMAFIMFALILDVVFIESDDTPCTLGLEEAVSVALQESSTSDLCPVHRNAPATDGVLGPSPVGGDIIPSQILHPASEGVPTIHGSVICSPADRDVVPPSVIHPVLHGGLTGNQICGEALDGSDALPVVDVRPVRDSDRAMHGALGHSVVGYEVILLVRHPIPQDTLMILGVLGRSLVGCVVIPPSAVHRVPGGVSTPQSVSGPSFDRCDVIPPPVHVVFGDGFVTPCAAHPLKLMIWKALHLACRN